MTAGASERTLLETTPTDIGPAVLVAPLGPPSHTHGTYGEMWQWIGDGVTLFSLVLVARNESDESGAGVRHRLLAEVERVGEPLLLASEDETDRQEIAIVPGASAAFMAHVDGVREGVPVHNRVMVATTHDRTYFLHVCAPDTPSGHEQASSMASSLRLVG